MAIFRQSRIRQRGIEVGIILILAVVAHVAWNQFYLLSRPVAQVGEQTINRRQYQELVEIDLAQQLAYIQHEINRYEQMGAQNAHNQSAASTVFGQDYQEALQLREAVVQDLKTLKRGGVDTGLIDHWTNQEIVLQGAAHENVTVSDEEIAAALVKSLAAPEEHAHATEAFTVTDQADPASAQTILTSTYAALTRLLKEQYGLTTGFSQEAFAAYIERQQRVELLSKRLEAKLMPDDQAPLSLQVNAQYLLLLAPTLAATDSAADTANLDDPASANVKARANELYQQLKDGADFLKLAHQHSANAEETVEPGWSVPDMLWPPLKEAVLSQPLNEVGPPIQTPTGWYIVKVLERAERPDTQKLEAQRAQRFQEWDNQQRRILGVKRF